MQFTLRPLIFPIAAVFAFAVAIGVTSMATTLDEAPFLGENHAAMKKMMMAMDVKPTGNVDADFVAMMIPHHQGAIDMAKAELRYGHNEQLRRLAQEIIVTQQQEIVTMRLALGEPPLSSALSPDQLSSTEAINAQSTSPHAAHTN
jgi:uncharacterized protein (DUF305 family)